VEAETAVLMDTCIFGKGVSLDDMVVGNGQDYFTVVPVYHELEYFDSLGRKEFDDPITKARTKLRTTQRRAEAITSRRGYQRIENILSALDRTTEGRSDSSIARFFYEMTKNHII